MKITKLGHCCLLIEEQDVRILTDPGAFTTAQNDLSKIDAVLITHEHADHFHLESLKAILANNPETLVIVNQAVAHLLEAEEIVFIQLDHKQTTLIRDVEIEALESPHALIYPGLPQVLNTGFFIANTLFYPGDALLNPRKPVPVLALPTAGPWLKLSEAIDYAKELKPQKCFPVHDALLSEIGLTLTANMLHRMLDSDGIEIITTKGTIPFEV